MKLLEEPRAPNPRRVRIYLAEKGIEVASEHVAINEKAHKVASIQALNPLQRLPILVLDDGTAISESMAICRYFEALYPTPSLFGETPLEVATIEMWNRRAELGLLNSVAAAFRHIHPAMSELEVPQIAEWGEVNKSRALNLLHTFNEALADNRFVAGEKFSIADITAFCAVDFMKPARIELPEALSAVSRWYEEVRARPSLQS